MKSEDWVSLNYRMSVYCGMLICWLAGGQKRCNSSPHDTSDLVSVCYCFWLQSRASASVPWEGRAADAQPSPTHLCWQVAALSSPVLTPDVDSETRRSESQSLPSEALSPLHLPAKRPMALAQSLPHSPAWALVWTQRSTPCYGSTLCGQQIPLCPTLPLTKESFPKRLQGLNARVKACISSSPASSGPHVNILHRNVPAAVQQDHHKSVTALREEG